MSAQVRCDTQKGFMKILFSMVKYRLKKNKSEDGSAEESSGEKPGAACNAIRLEDQQQLDSKKDTNIDPDNPN